MFIGLSVGFLLGKNKIFTHKNGNVSKKQHGFGVFLNKHHHLLTGPYLRDRIASFFYKAWCG